MSKPILYIDNLKFERTKRENPELYDVYADNGYGDQVGYVRLRHNMLTCQYPNHVGRKIYSANLEIDECVYGGRFIDSSTRKRYFTQIARKINQYK